MHWPLLLMEHGSVHTPEFHSHGRLPLAPNRGAIVGCAGPHKLSKETARSRAPRCESLPDTYFLARARKLCRERIEG